MNLETFKVLGMGMPRIDKTIFELVFMLEGNQYILTNVVLNKGENESIIWDLEYSDIYHYTAPNEKEGKKVCAYCAYEYEDERAIADDLICEKLNHKKNVEEIWKMALIDPDFKEVMTTLLKNAREELNKIKK